MALFSLVFAPIIASCHIWEEDKPLASWSVEGSQLGGGCQLPTLASVHHGQQDAAKNVFSTTQPTSLPFCLSHTAFCCVPVFFSHCLTFQHGTNPHKEKCVYLFICLYLWMLPTGRWVSQGLRVTGVCYSVHCIHSEQCLTHSRTC